MSIVKINTFDDVILFSENTLVICDIDDTILHYPDCMEKCMQKLQKMYPNMTYDFYLRSLENLIYQYKYDETPVHTDPDGFNNLLNRIKKTNGNLIFLTARTKSYEEKTVEHFDNIGLVYDEYEVHYTDNIITKGQYIEKYLMDHIQKANQVIFIDDYDIYIQSVLDVFPRIKCYHFKCK